LALAFALVSAAPALRASVVDTLPSRLTDGEYWDLVESFSEANGYFQSDNLVSNEIWYQWVIPALVERVEPGGVYMGVGPEQNFSYISALRPKMVFITDIRRGNLHTQLMYKALFELSEDRAEFVSRLFIKARPDGLDATSTASDIFAAYGNVETSAEEVYNANLRAVQDHLTKTRKLPLSAQDLDGIAYVYSNFYWFGPNLTYNSSTGRGRRNSSSYWDLMVATDDAGVARSYLASETAFTFLKDLHTRNLIVPVVGNLAGSKALRAVGHWIREHGAVVSTYYLSNVEQYLYQDGLWQPFCANVAALPLDSLSTFIRSARGGGGPGGGLVNQLGAMQAETEGCGRGITVRRP
jgi:hypothetical protein